MAQCLTYNSVHIQSCTHLCANPSLSLFNQASLYYLHTTILLLGISVMGFQRALVTCVYTAEGLLQHKVFKVLSQSACWCSHTAQINASDWISTTDTFLSDTLFFKGWEISFCVSDKWEVLAFTFTAWQRKSNRSGLLSRTHQKRVR